MGCLKNIIFLILLVFAIIGFNSVGGVDFVKKKIDEYNATTKGSAYENPKLKGIYGLKPPQ